MDFVVIILALVVFVVVAVLGLREKAARCAALAALAKRRGWRFDPKDDESFPERHERFDLFAGGHDRRISNTLAGRAETRFGSLEFLAGDYRYETGSGDDGKSHHLSYFYARLPFPLPAGANLVLRPEHLGDSLKAMVGLGDIDFESAEFSRRYYVRSSDRKFAYDVIHPRMMEYLLSSPCGRMELLGSWLTLRSSDEAVWAPEDIEATLDWLVAFVDLWPDYLVKDLGERYARNR